MHVTRDPGPAEGSRSEEKGESKCDSQCHGDQNSPPRPTAPRPPGPPGADPSTHAAWGRGLAAKGRGHARPEAQLIGGKLESVSVELPTLAASGWPWWIKCTAARGQGCEVAAKCCRVLRACPPLSLFAESRATLTATPRLPVHLVLSCTLSSSRHSSKLLMPGPHPVET